MSNFRDARIDDQGRLFFQDNRFGKQIVETGSKDALSVVEDKSDLPSPTDHTNEIYHVSSEASYYKSNGSSWIKGNSLSQDLNDAVVDAEDFATATSSFTDDNGNTFQKGAKGWAVDAEQSATDAETAQTAAEDAQVQAEAAETSAISAKDDAEVAASSFAQLDAVDGQADDISGTDLLDESDNVVATASGNSGELWYVRSQTDYYKSDGSQWVAQDLGLVPQVVLERRFLDVKEAGAKGDGATDDQGAINQAASDVVAGGELYIPPGTYNMTAELSFTKSLTVRFAPGAEFRVDPSVDGGQPLLIAGDGTTPFTGLEIVNPTLNGNESNRSGTVGTGNSLIQINGPIKQADVVRGRFVNGFAGAVDVIGDNGSNRSEDIAFWNCVINNVGEGPKLEHTDRFKWVGGSITNMTSQDNFEPHGNCDDWVLRDCYFAGPGPGNSTIEVFPQVGDINGGLIENVHTGEGEIRVAIGSGEADSDNTVRDITVRSCYLENSSFFAGDGGKWGGTIRFVDNLCEGPGEEIRSRFGPAPAARFYDSESDQDVSIVRGNTASFYEDAGFVGGGPTAYYTDNVIYNNAQNTSAGYQEVGIRGGGTQTYIRGNRLYDDQETTTQRVAFRIGGEFASIVENDIRGSASLESRLPSQYLIEHNTGDDKPTRGSGSIVLPDGAQYVTLMSSRGDRVKDVLQISPQGSLGNATEYWVSYFSGGGGTLRIRIDQAAGKDITFNWSYDFNGTNRPGSPVPN